MKRKPLKFVQFWLVMTCCLWSLTVVALAESDSSFGCYRNLRSGSFAKSITSGNVTVDSAMMSPSETLLLGVIVSGDIPFAHYHEGIINLTFDPTLISIAEVDNSYGVVIDNENGTLDIDFGTNDERLEYTLTITTSVTQTPPDGIPVVIGGQVRTIIYCPSDLGPGDEIIVEDLNPKNVKAGTVTIFDTAVTITPSPTPEPTATPSPTPLPTVTNTATPTPTPTNTATPTAVPTDTQEPTGCTAPQWAGGGIYETGEVVSHNGHEWEAKWYSNIPTDEPGTTGEWGVWLDLGACDGTTSSPTVTSTATSTLPPTATNTPLPTSTSTPMPTSTNTPSPTAVSSVPTATNTPFPTSTSTPMPTSTNTPSPTAVSSVPTATNTPFPTSTSTPFPTSTNTPSPTAVSSVPTNTPLPASTSTPIPTSTSTPLPTAVSSVPTATNTPLPTSTSTPVPTATNTATPEGELGTTGDAVPLGVTVAEMAGTTASPLFLCAILLILTCGYGLIVKRM